MRAERITDSVAMHGEGPVWDARSGRLMWVDLLRGDLLGTIPGGVTARAHVSAVAACVGLRTQGGCVVATERGFSLLDGDGATEVLPDLWDDPGVRMNDGAVDIYGRFWCGSMAYDAAPGRGALYCLDPDRSTRRVLGGVSISNGLGWSPDGGTAYYVDSLTRRVDVCSPDLSMRAPFATIPEDSGMPDGLTVDRDGGVWVALWGGSAVRRYAPDGSLDVIVTLPVRQVSSCAFGGDDLQTLFITTSAQDLAGTEPEAGSLYAVRPGVTGLPTPEFAG